MSRTDHSSRRSVVEDLDRDTVVTAGAGTGKTTALVGRICALVESGVPISDLVAITFTEAATAELRQRISSRLALGIESGILCADAIEDLDDAAISTIHSFAQRILREHSFEAGLPPGFQVLDSASARSGFDTSWRSFLGSLLGTESFRETLLRGLTVGLDLDSLQRVALEMSERVHQLGIDEMGPETLGSEHPTAPDQPATPDLNELWRSVVDLSRQLDSVEAMSYLCTAPDDRLLAMIEEKIRPLNQTLKSAIELHDEIRALSGIDASGILRAPKLGRAPDWSGQISEVRQACKESDDLREKLLNQTKTQVLDLLLGQLRTFTLSEFHRRRRDGSLTFQDLLVNAWLLVRGQPAVRKALRSQFRHVLIDELQDTDPIQIELAYLITQNDDPQRVTAQASNDTQDGSVRFFAVGDPKQSIYRFRGADSSLFDQAGARATLRLELVQNFRTVPGITGWVNHVFDKWFDSASPTQSKYTPLAAARSPLEGNSLPPVAYFGGATDGSAAEIRQLSASAAAAAIKRVHNDGWIASASTDMPDAVAGKPLRWRDIAVLLPTRRGLRSLTRALDQALVPYRIEGSSLLWDTDEVLEVLAVLRAAAEPGNPIHVIGALRTALLGCGDDDLADWSTRAGSWDPRDVVLDKPATCPVEFAMTSIAERHLTSLRRGASDVVDELLRSLNAFELSLVNRRPRDSWHRLRWLLDQARSADEQGAGTLASFLKWCDLQRAENPVGANAGPPDSDDDAVRIMTVHASKGLEFPVVVLTGLGQSRAAKPARMLLDEDGELQFKMGSFETPGYREAAESDKALDREEQVRLMYVATTRARDHLLLDLHHKQSPRGHSDCIAGQILAICQGSELWTDLVLDSNRKSAPSTHDTENTQNGYEAFCGEPIERNEVARLPERGTPPPWAEVESRLALLRTKLEELSRSPVVPASSLEFASAPESGHLDELGSSSRSSSSRTRSSATTDPGSDGARLHGNAQAPGRGHRPPQGLGHGRGLDPNSAKSVGRAVHQMLATADLTGEVPADLADRAGRSAHRFGVGQYSEQIESMVRRALDCPAVLEAGTRRHWQEMSLGAPIDGPGSAVIEGAADLVYESKSGLVVVDYKTDVIGGSDQIAKHAERHYPQILAYAGAIEQATGMPVVRAVLCFVSCDPAIEHEVPLPA